MCIVSQMSHKCSQYLCFYVKLISHLFFKCIPFICSERFGKSNVPYFLSKNPFFQPVHHRHAHKHKHHFSLYQFTNRSCQQIECGIESPILAAGKIF